MYCPRCGQEFIVTATVCSDCGVALVEALPPVPEQERSEEAPEMELETVLRTRDPALIPVVVSLLEAEGIPCLVQGPHQDPSGLSMLPGFNLVAGPAQLLVPRHLADDARRILVDQANPIPRSQEHNGGTGRGPLLGGGGPSIPR
jgi:hypothetical protein